ncbi:unnamed protein product [Fusarium fujikuroi]|uniref:Uncharacterized protein n=1 Tax=Fusarium fujikuroi TaxID=5127 RepID=A0A9Q9RMX0_FUSFU|nr:uncharacterized protein FFE2_12833 [Fusarium fujikuroi]VTT72533.1 unnamed protein product [Fusarium fujikuroi]VZI06387.1 unnamed protein product [Fusarium fujikuroi]
MEALYITQCHGTRHCTSTFQDALTSPSLSRSGQPAPLMLLPEKPVTESDVDSKNVMTPVARPVVFEEVVTPHTAAILLEGEKIWRRPSPVLLFSSSSPGSKDVGLCFPRGQLHRKLMPPSLWRTHSTVCGAPHKQSKSFWDIVNVILVAAVASIVFFISAFFFIAYIAPPLFELTTLDKQTSSHAVAIHEAAARGTHTYRSHIDGQPVSSPVLLK